MILAHLISSVQHTLLVHVLVNGLLIFANPLTGRLAHGGNDVYLQVRKIADETYEVALKHIRDNREAIDYIVDELVERETITGEVRWCTLYHAHLPHSGCCLSRWRQTLSLLLLPC